MPDTLPAGADAPDTGDLARDLAIAEIRSTIVDVPTVRRHKLSNTSVTAQNYVVVQVRLANGAEGIGEAATLGGPRWSEESVEAMKANIDAYLAPAVMAGDADALWVNSRIHDYCAGYAASPAGYARDTGVLARLDGRRAAALRAARERVAQRCGRFAPVDALTVAGVIRQREDAALAGHLAAEASLLALEVPLDDSPEYLRDLVERVHRSGDAEAFAALSPGMGVAASGRTAFAGLRSEEHTSELQSRT